MTQTSATPHRVIADRVRELRKGRGWSAQRLAEELARVGTPWDRSVVANLENGRRASVSVEELFALAYVLDVAPVNLMVPTEQDPPPYAPTPGLAISAEDAREWIRGRKPVGEQDMDTYFSKIAGSDFSSIYGALKAAHERRAKERDGER
ncbi:helix-turn-helix domain-containing protein [Micromonospora sp. NPDC049366]|uniref:helix-turn-helix domain-containing protein n=1 Tax=Micromonospora sp. NPDC049366 TaxID=3364271 RepID=UPI0037B4C9FE